MLRPILGLLGLLAILPILLLAIACSEEPATDAPAQAAPAASGAARPAVKTGIVTTSNIVADWVQAVGRDRVDVFSLLPPNADPHTFQPGARDITRVADADLVLSVGLSLEAGWLDDLLKNAARDPAKIVPLGDMVDPIDFVEIFEEHGDEEPEKALGRLLIGDGERGALSVIDLESGEVAQDRFDLVERAGRIYPTKSGRFAIAVSSDANTAHLLDGGIFLEAHGDHHDLVEVPAQRLGVDLEGDRPVHLYVGGEWAAIFYDGSGDVVLVNEHELEEQGAAYVPVRFNVGPHHGAAVPLEHDLVATTIKHPDFPANPDARRPIGAEIRDMDGNVLYRAEGCPDLHGDAGNGHLAAFGLHGRSAGARSARRRIRRRVCRRAGGVARGLPPHLRLGLPRPGPLLRPRFGGGAVPGGARGRRNGAVDPCHRGAAPHPGRVQPRRGSPAGGDERRRTADVRRP